MYAYVATFYDENKKIKVSDETILLPSNYTSNFQSYDENVYASHIDEKNIILLNNSNALSRN